MATQQQEEKLGTECAALAFREGAETLGYSTTRGTVANYVRVLEMFGDGKAFILEEAGM